MPLTTHCGPFSPSLETAFIAELLASKPSLSRKIAVVAPSRLIADRLQRLCAKEAGLSLLNIHFHTFHSLALEAVEAAGALKRTVVADPLFHDALLSEILKAKNPKAEQSRGLAAAYRSSLRDLIDAGVDPEALPEGFEEAFKDDARIKELLALVQEYLKRLEAIGVLPPSGAARLAAEAVAANRGGLERYERFLYYGFYDLTGVQGDFFHAVAAAHDAVLFFPLRRGHPAFAFAERSLSSPHLRLGGEQPRHLEPAVQTRAMGSALDRLFNPKDSVLPKRPPRLTVISASAGRDELWRIAKEILALTERKENPLQFHEIGVAARSIEPYLGEIKAVFAEHRIPVSLRAGEPLLRHPSAKLALNILSLHKRQYPARGVLDILDSPLFKRREEAPSWKAVISRQAVHSGWLQWEGKIRPYADKDFPLGEDGGPVVEKEKIRRFWEFLCELKEKTKSGRGEESWAFWAAHAKSVLESFFEPSAEDEAWGELLSALESLSVFDLAKPKALWEDFLELFEEKLRRSSLDSEKPSLGVRVLGAMDARGESFKALFVFGLSQGVFPRTIREDPLLPDEARRALRDSLGYWIQPKLEAYDEEKLLFYLLCSAAEESLFLLQPRSSDEGKALTPSAYLQELCRAAGTNLESAVQERVPRRAMDKLRAQAEKDPNDLSPKEISVYLSHQAAEVGPFYDGTGLWDAALMDSLSARLNPLLSLGDLTGLDGKIPPPAAFMAGLKAKGLSPSALESFSSCPFKFFSERLLGLREDERPSDSGELLPWVQGRLYHSVLEDFYGSFHFGKAVWATVLERSLEKVFLENDWRTLGVYPVLWEGEKRRMRAHLSRLIPADLAELESSGLKPAFFETELSGESAGLSLHGRADRIDAGGGTLRIVDYKRSWHKLKLRSMVGKMQQLQAPLYLELLLKDERFKTAPEKIQGAVYLAIEDSLETSGHEWRQEFSAADWRAARGEILQNAAEFLGMMERGEFLIAPEEKQGGACEYCSFSFVCRKAHRHSRARAENSTEREKFDAAHRVPALASKRGAGE